ncbi:isocitrate lyase/PEP mutase family protein [Roseomonas xinghualingensis]|uniref:isocitrate lyase/PEP mutase family protein n=1 Tax=Roseomonas xinghualingensis TaxID=2986475 RepID=UPI0021F0B5D8|nr:isocitrate lyase/PEP mutase family protein [Roseomonas sp. SXEYE001]MCV4210270.1 isocitrate lyase/PEP mutase family protein [Roseomonas sp. SXEYE001]
MSRTQRMALRGWLADDKCIVPASIFDPLSARLAEDIGFELGLVGGSSLALTLLGAPDLILVTASEVADQMLRICQATTMPVLLDADHGFGNALNVIHTVRSLEAAGVAGLTIEDTLLPLPFGANPSESRLTSVEEGAGKIRAARQARGCDEMVIIARTSAPQLTSVEDTIVRLQAYEEAGADALMVVGVRSQADLDAIAASTRLPLVVAGLRFGVKDPTVLRAARVRILFPGHAPILAAIEATSQALRAMRSGVSAKDVPGQASAGLLHEVTRRASYDRWIEEFMRLPGKGDHRDVIQPPQ